MGHARRQTAAQGVRHAIRGRPGRHPRGRALQHGHGPSPRRKCGDERDGRGPAAHHDHPLAVPVEVRGPQLRVHDRAPRSRTPRGRSGGAGARSRSTRSRSTGRARVGPRGRVRPDLHRHRPARLLRGPRGGQHPGPVPDVAGRCRPPRRCRPGRRGCWAHRPGPLPVPRPERVPEGEHVGVRADPGVAEEVPCAAQGLATLEDDVGPPRALLLEPPRRPDRRTTRRRRSGRRRAAPRRVVSRGCTSAGASGSGPSRRSFTVLSAAAIGPVCRRGATGRWARAAATSSGPRPALAQVGGGEAT